MNGSDIISIFIFIFYNFLDFLENRGAGGGLSAFSLTPDFAELDV
jgi:hypothetical protein